MPLRSPLLIRTRLRVSDTDRAVTVALGTHPGNTLWRGNRPGGVMDWPQASWGPPAVDVGHMRWNLALRWGLSAAQGLLDAYVATSGATPPHQLYWDLASLLDRVLEVGAPGLKRQAPAHPKSTPEVPRGSSGAESRQLSGCRRWRHCVLGGVYFSRAATVCGAAGWWGAPGNRVASIAVDTEGPKPRWAPRGTNP